MLYNILENEQTASISAKSITFAKLYLVLFAHNKGVRL